MTTRASLVERVRAFRGRRVAVVADLVADEFVTGAVERISREAPVLILQFAGSELRLGGGANAVHNIRTLGGEPIPIGAVGRDETGRALLKLLAKAGIDARHVVRVPGYETPRKTRIWGGGTHATKQQVVRIDRTRPLPDPAQVERLAARELARIRDVDGVLVSDYGLGLVTEGLLRTAVRFARSRKAPVTADSRHALLGLRGVTAVTPNEPEVEEALGVRIGNDRARLERAGKRLQARLKAAAVLITRGSDGMALFEAGERPRHLEVFGSDQVADVTGAGDTVIATFTLALASGASAFDAAVLANVAGGLVVMKRGTATVSARELEAAVRTGPLPDGVE